MKIVHNRKLWKQTKKQKKNEEKRRVVQSEERWKKGLVLLEYKCDAI